MCRYNGNSKKYGLKNILYIEIQNTDLEKHFLEDKFSRLDVKATTSNKEVINIER
jgi:hypothetical protein